MTALLVAAALLGAWELYVRLADIDRLVLSAPSEIAEALYDDRSLLLDGLGATATEMALGLLAALVVGVAVALALHFSALLRRGLLPLFVGSQAVPVAALSPVLVAWFGFGLAPKLTIVALVCFFPIVVVTMDGLRRVDDDLLRMMRSYGASRWRTFRLVEAPAALPAALTGAKLSVALAGIAAYLAEQSGSEEGIGLLIDRSLANLETARAWAGVVVLVAFSLTLFGALSLAERRAAPYKQPRDGRDARGSRA